MVATLAIGCIVHLATTVGSTHAIIRTVVVTTAVAVPLAIVATIPRRVDVGNLYSGHSSDCDRANNHGCDSWSLTRRVPEPVL